MQFVIDFSKAFDYVVRPNLWQKLISLGVRGKLLNVIRSMYDCIKSRVKVGNTLSNEFSCMLGVRQGECLSPLLFLLYLNDLEEMLLLNGYQGIEMYMFKICLLLYVDDIVLFSQTPKGLQIRFNILQEYCNTWKMKVNVGKTKVMVFRKSGLLSMNLNFEYMEK